MPCLSLLPITYLLMLFNFYLASSFFIILSLIIALSKKSKETIIRSSVLLLILQIICLALWQGTLAFTILITVILTLSLYEIARNYEVNYFLFVILCLGLFVAGFYSDRQVIELAAIWLPIISVIVFKSPSEKINSSSFLYLFSSGFLITSALFLIRIMEININAIILILLLLQFNDAFGYLFGKKFGKTYLFPTISPNKTSEGYFFGGLGIIIGIILLHTYIPILSDRAWNQDLLISSTILILGNAGDLMMSSLKRKLEIKDFSQILPGHGGVLDRFDNTFFVAPFFYLLLNNYFVL